MASILSPAAKKRGGVNEVEEEILPRGPAAADQLTHADAFTNAQPDEADQHPFPDHRRDVLRSLAAAGRGQRMLAAHAVERGQ
jgi:hypothetical protein